ncbi:MAG: lipopolysaccharide biosynthesis protein [Eisenbergiella sp.]
MLKKFVEYAIGNFLALLLGFISSPIITRIIAPEEMGKFSLFNTMTSLLFLVIMVGTDQAYVRYYNGEDNEGKSGLLHLCVGISLVAGIIVSMVLIGLYPQVSVYIIGEKSKIVVFLLIANIFSNILQRFAILEVRMSMKAKLYSAMNVWHKLSYILLVFAFYCYYKNNGIVLMLATVGANILCFMVCMVVDWEAWSKGKIVEVSVKLQELLTYGVPFVFVNAVNWIFEYMDRISIRQYCDFTEVGIYSAASTIVALLTACQNAFSAFWIPVAYSKYENDSDCKEFFKKMNRVVSFGMLIVAICMVGGKDFIIFLLGSDYRRAMYIFPFLTFMPVMYTISETTVLGINFQKKTYMHIVVAGVSATVNLIGNSILVPIYGAKGAAISTGASYIVLFLVRTIVSRKLCKVDFELGHLFIGLTLLCVLTVYASFNPIDIITIIMSVSAIVLVCFMYKDVLKDLVEKWKRKG